MKTLTVAAILLLPTLSIAFVAITPPHQRVTSALDVSRRTLLTEVTPTTAIGAAVAILTAGVTHPQVAMAKEESIPATRENVKAAFDALRYELNGGDGGVARMQRSIDAGDWEGLMEITKTYDQTLRKGKVGRVKSILCQTRKRVSQRFQRMQLLLI
jgi:flagellar biosynthesis protein FliP